MTRQYYSNKISTFILQNPDEILGILCKNNTFDLNDLQIKAWKKQIEILQQELSEINAGTILFEYTIPRLGGRVDNVLIVNGIIFLIEFKVGEHEYKSHQKTQVIDYALDLSNFHEKSHTSKIIPMLVSTEALDESNTLGVLKNNIYDVQLCNKSNLGNRIKKICQELNSGELIAEEWINSSYKPTPTIIEAACALYRGHQVEEISRSDASGKNLKDTTQALMKIIDYAKKDQQKIICFVTGVPGAGKTLAGINLIHKRQRIEKNELCTFLSGNGPLVDVLQEALARDEVKRNALVTKKEALRKTKVMIQNVHHFRDESLISNSPPKEKVVIFDEAQRAWDEKMTSYFMKRKKEIPNFQMSEPECLIAYMDRHPDWAVIICLVGGGQEINSGEAGITEWIRAISKSFASWKIYLSNQMESSEYFSTLESQKLLERTNPTLIETLHLSTSIRAFRGEKISDLVRHLLNYEPMQAQKIFEELKDKYPIFLTRNIDRAKKWVQEQAKGSERYGIVASSSAKRLRPYNIWVQNQIEVCKWFLNDAGDIRSSLFLEETATEFDVQGLELDYAIVGWDADLRLTENGFSHYTFKGSDWQKIHKSNEKMMLVNSYRVLLTRARQGMILFIPPTHPQNHDTVNQHYENVYNYLLQIGFPTT